MNVDRLRKALETEAGRGDSRFGVHGMRDPIGMIAATLAVESVTFGRFNDRYCVVLRDADDLVIVHNGRELGRITETERDSTFWYSMYYDTERSSFVLTKTQHGGGGKARELWPELEFEASLRTYSREVTCSRNICAYAIEIDGTLHGRKNICIPNGVMMLRRVCSNPADDKFAVLFRNGAVLHFESMYGLGHMFER